MVLYENFNVRFIDNSNATYTFLFQHSNRKRKSIHTYLMAEIIKLNEYIFISIIQTGVKGKVIVHDTSNLIIIIELL